MSLETWTAVDEYLSGRLAPSDAALEAALADSAAAGLPEIQVTPNQGKLLQLLASMQGARRILELGTLGGYSTIWLARALPANGKLVTLECDADCVRVATTNISRAGLADRVELRAGPALDSLARMVEEAADPFDLVFMDADKAEYPDYLAWVLRLSRRGTLIIADNVVRNGAVIESASDDPRVQGVRLFMEMLATGPRVSATAIQTVGSKGYDGLAFALVTADS